VLRVIDMNGDLRESESLDELVAQLEAEGQLPGEVARLFLRDPAATRGKIEPTVWPSEVCPKNTCRREVVLKRLHGTGLPMDLRRIWARYVGISLEGALMDARHPDWLYQPVVPDDFLDREDLNRDLLVKVGERNGKGRYAVRAERMGGALLRGRFDRLSTDLRTISDWKVTGYPKHGKDWGVSDSWLYQLQLYAYMMRLLFGFGPQEQKLEIWRIYRDPYRWETDKTTGRREKIVDIEHAFRRFDLPTWDDAQVEAKMGDHCATLTKALHRLAEDPSSFPEIVAEFPMDGRNMFAGKKCSMFCDVRDLCFKLAGKPEF